jgi:hypothetical protein
MLPRSKNELAQQILERTRILTGLSCKLEVGLRVRKRQACSELVESRLRQGLILSPPSLIIRPSPDRDFIPVGEQFRWWP